jgi:hypothetical protein
MPLRRHHHRATIHDRQSITWDQLEPLATLPLTPRQIQQKRLELIEELVALVIQDGEDLGTTQRRTLQGPPSTKQWAWWQGANSSICKGPRRSESPKSRLTRPSRFFTI